MIAETAYRTQLYSFNNLTYYIMTAEAAYVTAKLPLTCMLHNNSWDSQGWKKPGFF